MPKFQRCSRHVTHVDVSRATNGINSATLTSKAIMSSKVILQKCDRGHCCNSVIQQWPQFKLLQVSAPRMTSVRAATTDRSNNDLCSLLQLRR